LCAALAILVAVYSLLFQQPHTSERGLGWDGAQYTELARQCWREPMRATEPFVYRIGVPCLAALLPGRPEAALRVVNLGSSVLLIFLLDIWLLKHVPATVTKWLLVAFAFHWLTPLRQAWWYPTYIDPPALCAIVLALLARDRARVFALTCFFGGFIRETVIAVPVALAIGRMVTLSRDRGLTRATAKSWLRDVPLHVAGTGVVSAVIAIALTRLLATPTTDYWMADAAFYWAYTKPLPAYVLAWFITYGPALALLALRWPEVKRSLAARPEHAALLAIVAMLAWLGGSDTERFLLWGSPVVLVLIGQAAGSIEWGRARWPLAVLVTAQIINGRWLLPTPDYGAAAPRAWPVLTPWTAQGVELILSQTSDRVVSAITLIQYLALSAILIGWLKWREAQP
jgi:hypothetical protein